MKPLNEDEAATRLLALVPDANLRDAARELTRVQFAAWLEGYERASEIALAKIAGRLPTLEETKRMVAKEEAAEVARANAAVDTDYSPPQLAMNDDMSDSK